MLVHPQEPSLPFSLARVVRVVDEHPSDPPYIVFDFWKVKRADGPQASQKPNIFGRWVEPSRAEVQAPAKRSKRASDGNPQLPNHSGVLGDCLVRDVLVWPLTLTFANEHTSGSNRRKQHALLPFEVFDFLYLLKGWDLSATQYAFTTRGKEYAAHLSTRTRL